MSSWHDGTVVGLKYDLQITPKRLSRCLTENLLTCVTGLAFGLVDRDSAPVHPVNFLSAPLRSSSQIH